MEACKGEGEEENVLYSMEGMQLIGTMEFFGKPHHIAAATIKSKTVPCSMLVWDAALIRSLIKKKPLLHSAISDLLGSDMAAKFKLVEDLIVKDDYVVSKEEENEVLTMHME